MSGAPLQVHANIWTIWTAPFALSCGAFALGLCSMRSATYLTVETRGMGDHDLAQRFRRRSLVAGAVTAVIGALAALLARAEAPVLWQGLIGKALPFSVGAVLIGLATAAALLRAADGIARILVAAETACILAAWGIAQWPYLIVPDVTINNAASPTSVLAPLLIVSLLGLVVLFRSLWYLFSVVKRQARPGRASHGSRVTPASFVASLQPAAAPVVPPRDTDMFFGRASAAMPPASSAMQRAAPMLAVLLAIAAAPLVTATYDSMRQGLQSAQQRRQAPRRAHAQ